MTLDGPHYASYNSPGDICLRLNYENGDFLIVYNQRGRHRGYIGEYSSNGAILSYWGILNNKKDYEKLLTEYFNYNPELK